MKTIGYILAVALIIVLTCSITLGLVENKNQTTNNKDRFIVIEKP